MPTSNKRERDLARAKAQRQAARRQAEAARRRKRNATIAAAAGVVLVLGGVVYAGVQLSGGDDSASSGSSSASSSGSSSASASAASCKPIPTTKPGKQQFKAPPMTIDTKATYKATMVTNCGTVTWTMDPAKTPLTVNSFAFLAGKNYFTNTPCHRLTTEGIYVLQCGDPSGTGSGSPGYTIKDENLAGAKYPAGTVAMANSGPNTNGSQFFLVYKDTDLPPSYTPFGRITSGLDVVKKVAAAGSDPTGDGKPVQPVTVTSFTVAKQ